MESPTTVSPVEWQRRYVVTRDALMDLDHALAVQAKLGALSAHMPGAVELLASGRNVREAARVGAFAGSFNPFSVAHVGAAMAAHRAYNMDAFMWALSRVTVDKERVERASLVDRAIQIESYVRIAGPGETLAVLDAGLYADQAAAIRAQLATTAELWLVVGFDKAAQIFDPHYYSDRNAALRRLFSAAALLVAPRAGHDESDLASLLSAPENRAYADRVRYLHLPRRYADISSTAARMYLANKRPDDEQALHNLKDLLPPEGVALALATGAYAMPQTLATGETLDLYWLRLAWFAALGDLPPRERPHVSLARLIAVGSASTEAGAEVRRWLGGARWPGGPSTLVQLIEAYV
jgi:nicotinamide-nucleotide adenylyltransferase